VNLRYSTSDRSTFVRVAVRRRGPASGRLELRCPDASCNPYLAFSAIVMAALDGIDDQVDPGAPLVEEPTGAGSDERAAVGHVPETLGEALTGLERDHEFLLKGGVFTEDVIEHWIKHKTEGEVNALRARPHPYEFCLYYDV
jgi:glutamine synthetase